MLCAHHDGVDADNNADCPFKFGATSYFIAKTYRVTPASVVKLLFCSIISFLTLPIAPRGGIPFVFVVSFLA